MYTLCIHFVHVWACAYTQRSLWGNKTNEMKWNCMWDWKLQWRLASGWRLVWGRLVDLREVLGFELPRNKKKQVIHVINNQLRNQNSKKCDMNWLNCKKYIELKLQIRDQCTFTNAERAKNPNRNGTALSSSRGQRGSLSSLHAILFEFVFYRSQFFRNIERFFFNRSEKREWSQFSALKFGTLNLLRKSFINNKVY